MKVGILLVTHSDIGKQLLQRKARGYVSFIKGADPYTFPYRIFPYQFNRNNSLKFIKQYPLKQFNGKHIIERSIGSYVCKMV